MRRGTAPGTPTARPQAGPFGRSGARGDRQPWDVSAVSLVAVFALLATLAGLLLVTNGASDEPEAAAAAAAAAARATPAGRPASAAPAGAPPLGYSEGVLHRGLHRLERLESGLESRVHDLYEHWVKHDDGHGGVGHGGAR
mmetsp:Transcript_14739/g.50650  ORF Transcript_14739/g.50650 Transcript_14739/m.50650 type:complete len:141 (-) Transcript_14739:46-468(-)